MGVFNKKTKAIEKLKDLEDNKYNFTPHDLYALENQIKAKEMIIDSQVAKLAHTDAKSVKWNDWIRVNLWADYFANRFVYEASDYEHNVIINRAIRYAFIYGYIGIWNNNGTPMLVTAREDSRLYSDTVEVILINDDFKEFITESYKRKAGSIKVKKDEIIWYRFSSLGYPAMIMLEPVFKFEDLTQRALYNETLSVATRIVQDVDAANPSIQAAKQFVEFKSPIIQRVDGGTDRFTTIPLATNTEALLATIEYTKNYYYDIVGRRTNSDFKKAHSLDAELEASQINMNAIERDKYMFLKKFLREYSKMFSIEIMIENLDGTMINVNDKIRLELPMMEDDDETGNSDYTD